MKTVRTADPSNNPLMMERTVFSRLRIVHAIDDNSLRVRVFGQRLLLDGFVADLDGKSRIENTCKEIAPGMQIVNRLHVGLSHDRAVANG